MLKFFTCKLQETRTSLSLSSSAPETLTSTESDRDTLPSAERCTPQSDNLLHQNTQITQQALQPQQYQTVTDRQTDISAVGQQYLSSMRQLITSIFSASDAVIPFYFTAKKHGVITPFTIASIAAGQKHPLSYQTPQSVRRARNCGVHTLPLTVSHPPPSLMFHFLLLVARFLEFQFKINQIPFGGCGLPGPAGGAKALPDPLAAIRTKEAYFQ